MSSSTLYLSPHVTETYLTLWLYTFFSSKFHLSSCILIQRVSVWSPSQQHTFSGFIPDLLNQTLAWSPVILLDQPSSLFWSRPASEHQSSSEFHLLKNCTTTQASFPIHMTDSFLQALGPSSYSICFLPDWFLKSVYFSFWEITHLNGS